MSVTAITPSIVRTPILRRQALLHRAFWCGVAGLAVTIALTARPQNVESAIGAALIMFASLLPAWIWTTGKIKGLPLFPVYAATFFLTFALPLLYEHPIVALFLPLDQLVAALTVTAFLLVGTFVWWQVGKRAPRPARRCLLLNAAPAEFFFLGALAGGIALAVATYGNWLNLSPGIYSVVRAVTLALEALACFVLSFRSGTRELRGGKRVLFQVLFAALLVSTLPGLLLVNAMSLAGVAALGFTLGAQRFPWRSTLVALLLFVFLHAGKAPMREVYWQQERNPTIQPISYPAFVFEWLTTSSRQIFGRETESIEGQSLLERASLMQILLFVQTMTPDAVPYMWGETYAIIPNLLVPRILSDEKVASHEGTYLLNIHYGMQTREDTARTTIGFGLLNEAYANFGFIGVGLLAVLLGASYGAVARWARMAPVLSFRSLFAVVVASYSFQSEFAAGVYVAALFQSMVALSIVAALFMRKGDCTGSERSILE